MRLQYHSGSQRASHLRPPCTACIGAYKTSIVEQTSYDLNSDVQSATARMSVCVVDAPTTQMGGLKHGVAACLRVTGCVNFVSLP